MQFDYLALGDAALELGIPRPTLRHYCDMGKIVVKRASDGSRLFSPEEINRAKAWLKQHAKQRAQERERARKQQQRKAQAEAERVARLKARVVRSAWSERRNAPGAFAADPHPRRVRG